MGWRITRDYLHESRIRRYKGEENLPSFMNYNMKGKEREYRGGKDIRIKTYDDDGTLYYEAVCDSEDCAEQFFDWSQYDSGTTTSKIKLNGNWGSFIS